MKIKLNYKKFENNNNNKAIIGLNNFKIQNAYIDQDGNYFQSKGRFEIKYSLYIYKESQDDDDNEDYENYLLLRIDIPGNISRLIARSTYKDKDDKYRRIIIRGNKEKDIIPEQSKKNFAEIYDNRTYKDISYFNELKGNLHLNKINPINKTDIYKIHLNYNNREKYFQKNNEKVIVKDEINERKLVEGEMIVLYI